jgi:hypothetical protein
VCAHVHRGKGASHTFWGSPNVAENETRARARARSICIGCLRERRWPKRCYYLGTCGPSEYSSTWACRSKPAPAVSRDRSRQPSGLPRRKPQEAASCTSSPGVLLGYSRGAQGCSGVLQGCSGVLQGTPGDTGTTAKTCVVLMTNARQSSADAYLRSAVALARARGGGRAGTRRKLRMSEFSQRIPPKNKPSVPAM